MSITTKTRVMLWGRSAHRCDFPECRRELIVGEFGTDDASLIGEICHIVADKSDGPRGASSLTSEERDLYSNLILLCNIHHKIVDDCPEKYTVEILKAMKEAHEQWVQESLRTYDHLKQRDEEIYAAFVDEWAKRVDLDNWIAWSSHVMGSGQPHMLVERDQSLREARTWLFSRIWPKRYIELEASFENFRRVLHDFQEVFHSELEVHGEMIFTRRFYQIDEWNPELYKKLLRRFTFHVVLVMDLMLELTRAANYICDRVREFVDPMFRMKEGAVLAESGPYMDFSFVQHRVEYGDSERVLQPYPGLTEFVIERKQRDSHFGEGADPDDPEFRISE